MLVGYARVSITDQNMGLQQDALYKAGCDRIFTDKASANMGQVSLEKIICNLEIYHLFKELGLT